MMAPCFLDSLRISKVSGASQPLADTFLRGMKQVRSIYFEPTALEGSTNKWTLSSLVRHLNASSIVLDQPYPPFMLSFKSLPSDLVELEVLMPPVYIERRIFNFFEVLVDLPNLRSLIVKGVYFQHHVDDNARIVLPSSLTRFHMLGLSSFPMALFNAKETLHASDIVDFALGCPFEADIGTTVINLNEWLPHNVEKLVLDQTRRPSSIAISDIPLTVHELHIDADHDFFKYELVRNLPYLGTLHLTCNSDQTLKFEPHLLPRGLKNLYLRGRGHEQLTKSSIDQLPSTLRVISVQSIDFGLISYFIGAHPTCRLDIFGTIGIDKTLSLWRSFFPNELVNFNPAVFHSCIRVLLESMNTTMDISVSPSDIGVWRDALSFTLSSKELNSTRSTNFDAAALGSRLFDAPDRRMPNLITMNIDLTGASIKAVKLRELPKSLTSLELHCTPILGDFSDLPPNLTRIESNIEADMKNYLELPSALPHLHHLDTPFWTFSANALFKTMRKNMSMLRLEIADILDDQVIDLLTNKIDAASRASMEISLLYNVSGALIEDDFRDFEGTVTWSDVVAATQTALTRLLDTPFPGTSIPIKARILHSAASHIKHFSIPYSAQSVRLDPGEVFSLAPIRQLPTSAPQPNEIASALAHITSISGISPQASFFMPYSPLVKLELVGVFVNANWWSQLPVTLREMHISSSSSLPTGCSKLPAQLESFVYLCNVRHFNPLSLPLKSLPRSLVHFVSLPSSFPMQSMENLDGVLDLPNLKTLRLGPTSGEVASALVNFLPMDTISRMEVELVLEAAPTPQQPDKKIEVPTYPSHFANLHLVEEVAYEDLCNLPRPPKLRVDRPVTQHVNAFATGNGSSELKNAGGSWASEYSHIRSTMKVTTINAKKA